MMYVLSKSVKNCSNYELNKNNFTFSFFNIDISVNIQDSEFSVCNLDILLEGHVSQNVYLVPSFYIMSKNG